MVYAFRKNMLIIGFIGGFIFCFICFLTAFCLLRVLIFKTDLVRKTENWINILQDEIPKGAEIVYPNLVKEKFEESGEDINDLLK
jgi:hypothetical protein